MIVFGLRAVPDARHRVVERAMASSKAAAARRLKRRSPRNPQAGDRLWRIGLNPERGHPTMEGTLGAADCAALRGEA